jgi:hypothetical protein
VKGLLHRLAARAAGATAAVRSDARLPLGRTSFGRDAAHAVAEQSFAVDVRVPAPGASAVFAQPRDSLAGDTAPMPMLDRPPRRLQTPPADASPSAAPDTRSAAHALLGDASPPSPNPSPPLNPPPNPPPRLVDSTPADPGHASGRARSTTESAGRSSALPTPEALRSDVTAAFVREPSLLIPLAVPHPAAPPAITAPAITRRPGVTNSTTHAVASEEPSEVHIRIGRIEVTAVHEAAPPRRPPVPSPMSLDAYLAKRGRT